MIETGLGESVLKMGLEDWTALKGIELPPGGWKELRYYVVEAKFARNNPPSRYLFYTGFLNGKDGVPGGYNHFPGLDEIVTFKDAYWMRAIALLPDIHSEELAGKGTGK